ncbi:MAG: hypothetical protein WBB45_12010 [Cyclobacteriaceae bacterium]
MSTKSQSLYLVYGAPAFIILVSVCLGSGLVVALTPPLAMGILYDLTLLSPLIYLLLIRNKDIPRITAVPVFIIGLVVATLLLPTDTTHYLTIRNVVLPLVELTVLGFITFQAVRAARVYRKVSAGEADFLTAFRRSAMELIPYRRVADIFTTEAGMLYYALFAWRFRKSSSEGGYTSHQKSGSVALFAVIIFLILAETFVLHILLVRWSVVAAWVMSGLSMYSAVQLLGHVKAMITRRSYLSPSHIHLRYGLFGDVSIPVADVSRVEVSGKDISGIEGSAKLSLLGDLEGHNVILHLESPASLTGPYGISKVFTCLGVFIDDSSGFATAVRRLQHHEGTASPV